MDYGMIGKIEKAKRYAEEPERFCFDDFTVCFDGDNSGHTVTCAKGDWQYARYAVTLWRWNGFFTTCFPSLSWSEQTGRHDHGRSQQAGIALKTEGIICGKRRPGPLPPPFAYSMPISLSRPRAPRVAARFSRRRFAIIAPR